jgi:hypothetical protein
MPVDKRRFRSPEALYLWAIANSDIVFPYLSLKQAEEHLKVSLQAPKPWGMIEGKCHLPQIESIAPDSRTWILLAEILRAQLGEENVLLDSDAVESVPSLDNSTVEKNPIIETILIRLMELAKNPLSCTIRKSGWEKSETIVRNAVDFVVIDSIYQHSEIYSNLTLSGSTVSAGRRVQKIENLGAGGKTVYTNIFRGYRLADLLGKYLDKPNYERLEQEPFIALILNLLEHIASRVKLDDFILPKHIFESPSSQLRALVREGPQIKTKKGLRHNLYVPFSFVKSAECASYPEVIRRELIESGNEILKNLDQINKMDLTDANEIIPVCKDFLSLVYTLSDEIRKEWRQRAYVPELKFFEVFGRDNLAEVISEKESLSKFIASSKRLAMKLPFVAAKQDPSEQAALVASVKDLVNQRQARRGNPAIARR